MRWWPWRVYFIRYKILGLRDATKWYPMLRVIKIINWVVGICGGVVAAAGVIYLLNLI